jgi:hypothetical protein
MPGIIIIVAAGIRTGITACISIIGITAAAATIIIEFA